MIELDKIIAILSKLSKEEKAFLRRHIDKHNESTKSRIGYKKILIQLLELSIDDNGYEYIEFINKFNKATIKKKLQRLTERILNLLISRELLFENKVYDLKSTNVFMIRRKIMIYDVLTYHGVSTYPIAILNQVINLASQIEYYDYLIIALEKKLIKMSLRNGIEEYKKIYNAIQKASECNLALKNSNYFIRMYSSNYSFNQGNIIDEDINEVIKRFEAIYEKTKSKSLKINIFYLYGIKYSNEGNYDKCIINFEELYGYLTTNSEVVFNSYFISCLLNIAEFYLRCHKFQNSIKNLNKIFENYLKNEFNELLVLEMYFLNYFYMGDLEESKLYLNKIIQKEELLGISKYFKAKHNYYYSVLVFLDSKPREALNILEDSKALESDKEGWNIGIRLSTIIYNIELDRLTLVESQIENFRKYLSRLKSKSNFYFRIKIIYKILLSLVNYSFNYQKVYQLNKDLFSKLDSSKSTSENRWTIRTPEIIPFNNWFYAKMKDEKYNHNSIMKHVFHKK